MGTNNEATDRLLINYQEGAKIEYASSSTITVTLGQVACSNSDESIVRWRRNTTNTTVSWTSLDTGSESASQTYYLYAVADTDVTTFTISISTSSSAPSGKTYYARLGSFSNNSSSNIVDDNTIVNDNETAAKQFGSWISRSNGVTYHASSDGFVCGTFSAATAKVISGYTDSSSSPTTLRCRNYSHGDGTDYAGFTMPVKTGDYWYTNNCTVVYWIPNE